MKKLLLLIVLLICWRQCPEGERYELVYSRDLYLQKDTIIVRHYHKSGDMWYVIDTAGTEYWCDYLKKLRME
jgi:hypothetical protein